MAKRIDPMFISELSSKVDIESIVSQYVPLKRQGRRLVGICPFHSERSPSLTVYTDTSSFYCFGCGAGGDAVTFIRRIENLEYIEAVKLLAERVGMALPENDDPALNLRLRIFELNRAAARFYHSQLMADTGRRAQGYLVARGLGPAMARRFGLGYAPDSGYALTAMLRGCGYTDEELLGANLSKRSKGGNLYDAFIDRIIFPIIDRSKRVIAFGGRAMQDGQKPKYLNSADTPVYRKSANLYALNLAKNTSAEELILCEGYIDTIALHSAGLDNAVATLGTALTEEQARLIARHTQSVIIAYDSDEAGRKAARRAAPILEQLGLRTRVLQLTGAKDPDEFVGKYGVEKLRELIQGSVSAIQTELELIYERVDTAQPQGKIDLVNAAIPILVGIASPVQRQIYIAEVARRAELDKSILTEQVERKLKQQHRQRVKAESGELFIDASPSYRRDFDRKRDRAQAVALEKLLLYFVQNPNSAPQLIGRIQREDIVSELDAELFYAIAECIGSGNVPDMAYLGAVVSDQALCRMSEIGAEHTTASAEDALSYIELIEQQREKRQAQQAVELSDADFASSFKRFAEKKRR